MMTTASHGISRRTLLIAGGTALAVPGLVACSSNQEGDGGGGPDGEDKRGPKGLEAPMLAAMVEAGDLPPVEERLPVRPLVVEPVEGIGVYGGEWRSALAGRGDSVWLWRTIGYENLVNWDIEWTEPMPNILEAVEPEDEGRVYTLRIREGLRWSDGELFTADDIMFWAEDVVGNEELGGGFPSALMVRGKPPTVERIDDYTVQFVYPEPYGLFLQRLATIPGRGPNRSPRHYLEQFHGAYNNDADALAEQEGFDGWPQLFGAKADPWSNADLPTLNAWRLTTPLGEGTRVVAERNPYYFKTDPDGSQLPYLDRVVYEVLTDAEVILLKATNGELDMHVWHINTPTNKPVLAGHREKSDYRFFDVTFAWMNRMVINLNMTCEDQQLREVFRNRDFRVGLSHAINREEMVDAVFQRQGEGWQAAPRRESAFFDEEFAKQYTEHNVDLANEHLNRAGYTDRDDDGFRLRPDGQRISFAVDAAFPAALSTFWPDALDLVQGYWREVGIDMRVKAETRELWRQRHLSNKYEAAVWSGDGGGADAMLDPRFYFPYSSDSHFAKAWAYWYLGTREPMEEPSDGARRQMELYDQIQITFDEAEKAELFREILRIAKDEFYCIGTVLPAGDYGIVKNNFHNVQEPMIMAWMYPTPGPTQPAQYFIAD